MQLKVQGIKGFLLGLSAFHILQMELFVGMLCMVVSLSHKSADSQPSLEVLLQYSQVVTRIEAKRLECLAQCGSQYMKIRVAINPPSFSLRFKCRRIHSDTAVRTRSFRPLKLAQMSIKKI